MPMQSEVQVMRFSWTEISCAGTQYLLRLTGNLLGDSQAQFELSSYWTNLTYFEMPLPCGSAYAATVESRNAAGTSEPSAALSNTTGRLHLEAPCWRKGLLWFQVFQLHSPPLFQLHVLHQEWSTVATAPGSQSPGASLCLPPNIQCTTMLLRPECSCAAHQACPALWPT